MFSIGALFPYSWIRATIGSEQGKKRDQIHQFETIGRIHSISRNEQRIKQHILFFPKKYNVFSFICTIQRYQVVIIITV